MEIKLSKDLSREQKLEALTDMIHQTYCETRGVPTIYYVRRMVVILSEDCGKADVEFYDVGDCVKWYDDIVESVVGARGEEEDADLLDDWSEFLWECAPDEVDTE